MMGLNKKLVLAALVLGIAVFFAAGHSSFAATAEKIVNVDFPCPDGSFGLGNCQPNDSIPNYLNNIYKFAVGIAGLLALGMIVAGGVYYTVSAGSSDKQKEAKDMITSALLGVGLLLGSYLILKTINPQIVTLDLNFTGVTPIAENNTPGNEIGGGNNCPDFSRLEVRGVGLAFDGNCSIRRNLTTEDIQIDKGDYYGENTGTIDKGSDVWTYPYFIKDNGPKSAGCLIYAYREKQSETKIIRLQDTLSLCAPQPQKSPVQKCNQWTLEYRTPPGLGALQTINIPVSGSFDYSNPNMPPPSEAWPESARVACYPPRSPIKACSSNLYCSSIKTELPK